jgi:pyridoxine kinase
VVGYNHFISEYFLLPYTEIPVHFPGTGDMFSAILIGHLLNDEPLKPSTRVAMDALYRLIEVNKDNEDKNRGIPIENWLSLL